MLTALLCPFKLACCYKKILKTPYTKHSAVLKDYTHINHILKKKTKNKDGQFCCYLTQCCKTFMLPVCSTAAVLNWENTPCHAKHNISLVKWVFLLLWDGLFLQPALVPLRRFLQCARLPVAAHPITVSPRRHMAGHYQLINLSRSP